MGTIIMTSAYRAVLLYGLLAVLVFSVVVSGKKLAKEERGNQEAESGRKSRGIWFGGDHRTGSDHGHGHGWLKMHNDRHHGHSTKLSEAYVKFHGLGEKGNKGGSGIFGRIGNVLSQLGIGRGDPDEESDSGWGSNSNNNNNNNNNNNGGGGAWSTSGGGGGGGGGGGSKGQEFITIQVQKPSPPMSVSGGGGGGGGGWGAPPPMMQMQSGWSNPQMQTVVAQPTGWANANNQQSNDNSGGNKGGNSGGNSGGGKQTGWATGDFSSYRPPKGNKNQGHFQFNLPTGKPAYIQKLKPIIDLPKIHLHGLGWR